MKKLFIIILVALIASCSSKTSQAATSQSNQSPASQPSKDTGLYYRVAWDQRSPAGIVRSIVVDASFRKEQGLRDLAETLKDDTAAFPVALVTIFDNEKAASLMSNASLSDDEEAFLESHEIAIYSRNNNTGLHELQIMLHGPKGKVTKIEY